MQAKVVLRNWREENVRQSDDVVDLWEELLADAADDLGEEKWMIVEQVCVAAMDTNRVDVLDICLKDLRANFDKDSLRVRRLLAMRAEVNMSRNTYVKVTSVTDYLFLFTDDGRLRQSSRHSGLYP